MPVDAVGVVGGHDEVRLFGERSAPLVSSDERVGVIHLQDDKEYEGADLPSDLCCRRRRSARSSSWMSRIKRGVRQSEV
jgi:hypothetical protein